MPPTGAKGLNLAVGDVVTFARALAHRTEPGSAELLDAYSATCLSRVWQAERFSDDMTPMLHGARPRPSFCWMERSPTATGSVTDGPTTPTSTVGTA